MLTNDPAQEEEFVIRLVRRDRHKIITADDEVLDRKDVKLLGLWKPERKAS